MSEILWDVYDVPHIYADDPLDLFHGLGWAQMRNRGSLLLTLFGQSRGRAAEYWGEGHIASDRWVHTLGIPTRGREWYRAQSSEFRSCLDAFAAGLNDSAAVYAEAIDPEAKRALPITPVDVVAHAHRVVNFVFVVDPLISPSPAYRGFGSNAWAISPARSASGNAMLLANPHLPWSDLYTWFEAHLNLGDLNAYGAALVGFPTLVIAFNDFMGWTHTAGPYAGVTLYELTLESDGYLLDGEVRPFTVVEQRMLVRHGDDAVREEVLTTRESVHGVVVAERDGRAYALRVPGLDQPRALEQWWRMAWATNLREFEDALRALQIPTLTVTYAGRDGHVMQLFNGQIPVRGGGSAEDWVGPVDGTDSRHLWTRTHVYDDLPRVVDPPTGWLQNANDPPWTSTFPEYLSPAAYPAYIAPRGPMSFRAQRSARMLQGQARLSLEDLADHKFSTRSELADRIVEDLVLAASEAREHRLVRAANVLSAWDRTTDAPSRGAVLFAFWLNELDVRELFATPWEENAPLTSPRGLSDPDACVAALARAATKVEETYGALDVEWGRVFRLPAGTRGLPASGGDERLGCFQEIWFAPDEGGRFVAAGGDSFTAAVEFSNPVRALVLNVNGNAAHSDAATDPTQFELHARKHLRPAWNTRSEILRHLASRETCSLAGRLPNGG